MHHPCLRFGFASAVSNPFTVLLASEIIGVNPLDKIWFRVIVFVVMFPLLMAFLFRYLRRLKRDPASSLTWRHDEKLRLEAPETGEQAADEGARAQHLYGVSAGRAGADRRFLPPGGCAELYRGGAGRLFPDRRHDRGPLGGQGYGNGAQKLLWGFISVLPTLVFIAMAASVKFILDRGLFCPPWCTKSTCWPKGAVLS
jgi:hypothetical protein